MDPWIIALAVLAALCVVLLLVPVRLHLSLRGRGDPSGAWAIAGGAQVGPLALSSVAARGVTPTVGAHLLGKRLWQRELAPGEAEEGGEVERARRLARQQKERYQKLERWFDPLDLAFFLVSERRRIRVEQFDLDVDYSFEDIALTGKTLAALYLLGGALPPPFVIRPRPSWDTVDRADLAVTVKIRLRPGLVLVDTAWFVVRRVKLRRRRSAARGATEAI